MYNKILDSGWCLFASICHIIGAQSHGCPITAVQLELFVIGYLLLDTIHKSITWTLTGSFLLFPYCLQNVWNIHVPMTFSLKRGSRRCLNLLNCVTDTII